MSAYQREEQNNTRLEELASKISSLRSVTNDIHAQASDYSLIDSTVSMVGRKTLMRFSCGDAQMESVMEGHEYVGIGDGP